MSHFQALLYFLLSSMRTLETQMYVVLFESDMENKPPSFPRKIKICKIIFVKGLQCIFRLSGFWQPGRFFVTYTFDCPMHNIPFALVKWPIPIKRWEASVWWKGPVIQSLDIELYSYQTFHVKHCQVPWLHITCKTSTLWVVWRLFKNKK